MKKPSLLAISPKVLALFLCSWCLSCLYSPAHADMSEGPILVTSAITLGIVFIVGGLALSTGTLFGGIAIFKKLFRQQGKDTNPPSPTAGQNSTATNQAPPSENESKDTNS